MVYTLGLNYLLHYSSLCMMEADKQIGRSSNGGPSAPDDVLAHDQGPPPAETPANLTVDRTKAGLPASTLDEALWDLTLVDPKKYGIAVLLRVATAWARQSSGENERIAQYREENAGLKATLRENKKNRPLRQAAIALGPIIGLVGIELLTHEKVGMGLALLVAGLLLPVLALLASGSGSDG